MVLRDRNHPSIVMWSIGNEVDYPNDPYTHPILAQEGIGQQSIQAFLEDHPRAERLGDISKELVAAVKEADSSRPVTAALAGAVMSNYTDYPFVLDLVGYNYTENKYDSDHELYPERILYGSENRHDIPSWKAVKDKAFIFGQFLWTGIDYLGESGAWPSRGSTPGLLDLAGNIKPLGYFRKALWSEEPMAYIGTSAMRGTFRMNSNRFYSNSAPQIWNYESNATVAVACYTNCEEAELYLNGKLVGERKPYDTETGIIGWSIPYEPGTLQVKAYNGGVQVAENTIVTNTMAQQIKAEVLPSVNGELLRQIRVTILDTQGNPSSLADNEISCNIQGGSLLGMENASSNATDNFLDAKQRCINGKLLIYAKKRAADEPMTVTLSSSLLETAVLTLE